MHVIYQNRNIYLITCQCQPIFYTLKPSFLNVKICLYGCKGGLIFVLIHKDSGIFNHQNCRIAAITE